MTEAIADLGTAAEALADVLERENRLLAALDLAGAAAMLADKRRAVAGFTSATERARKAPPPPAAQRNGLAAIGRRLVRLASDNRRLLERGMAAQKRVVAVIARAARAAPVAGGRYGARGALSTAARAQALAFSARV